MLMQLLTTILTFIEQQLIAPLSAAWAHWRLAGELQVLKAAQFVVEAPEESISESRLEELEKDFEDELQRSYRIVEKGRAGLFMIGVTIALIATILNYPSSRTFGRVEVIVLLSAVGCLVLSAMCLTVAVNIRERFGTYLDDLIKAEGERLTIIQISKQQKVLSFYRYGKLNQTIATIVANYVAASYVGIRNGIVLIALFFAIDVIRHHWK
ncbi:hypothetical protein ETAA8_08920 [Anatilimnocola aggregata]|uniref:Uncharacterized protein n=1 Tax=Anatilimnocola aggregata TaxID=2528021 RepID=A0A517Y6H5_9BACT|nr:hypothetical protein [Anatilimnocola aggregata]QDU25820.1 hypothetical protein ETAA8_08920 [Anatilimnocola aggregata]